MDAGLSSGGRAGSSSDCPAMGLARSGAGILQVQNLVYGSNWVHGRCQDFGSRQAPT